MPAPPLFQAFTITVHRLRAWKSPADLVIAPDLGRTASQYSFGDRERLVAVGERSAFEAIESLRALSPRL